MHSLIIPQTNNVDVHAQVPRPFFRQSRKVSYLRELEWW